MESRSIRQTKRKEGKRKSTEVAPESGTRRLKRAKRLPTNGSTDNGPVEEDKTAELAAPYSNGAGGSRISHKLKKATGSVVGGRQKSPARDGSHGSARVTEVAEPSGVAESRVAAWRASRPTVWSVVRDGNRPLSVDLAGPSGSLSTGSQLLPTDGLPSLFHNVGAAGSVFPLDGSSSEA